MKNQEKCAIILAYIIILNCCRPIKQQKNSVQFVNLESGETYLCKTLRESENPALKKELKIAISHGSCKIAELTTQLPKITTAEPSKSFTRGTTEINIKIKREKNGNSNITIIIWASVIDIIVVLIVLLILLLNMRKQPQNQEESLETKNLLRQSSELSVAHSVAVEHSEGQTDSMQATPGDNTVQPNGQIDFTVSVNEVIQENHEATQLVQNITDSEDTTNQHGACNT